MGRSLILTNLFNHARAVWLSVLKQIKLTVIRTSLYNQCGTSLCGELIRSISGVYVNG